MLMRARRGLADVPTKIAKAEACGVDCQEYKQGYAYLSGTIDAYLREFFPGQIVPPTESGVTLPPE
jgi:hypothetical protein